MGRARRTAAAAALAAAMLGAGVGAGSAEAACAGAGKRAADLNEARYGAALLCLVNEARGRTGGRALAVDARLRSAASGHTRAMVRGNFFSHTGRGGRGPAQRAAKAGYTRGARAWSVGENIAWGGGSRSTPLRIFRGWMSSPGHRSTMLRRGFRDVGLGVTMGSPSARVPSPVTVTAAFGFRRG